MLPSDVVRALSAILFILTYSSLTLFFPRAARRCRYVFEAGSIPTETTASRGATPLAWRAALRSRDPSCSVSASGLP